MQKIQMQTISDFYNIVPQKYVHAKIKDAGFSRRLTKCLTQSKITTVSQLLQMAFEDLARIKNLGKNSIDEVKTFCEKLEPESNQIDLVFLNHSNKLTIKNSVVFENASQMSQGIFSFCENIALNDDEKEIMEKYRLSFSTIGEDFAIKCLHEPLVVKRIMLGLSEHIIEEGKYRRIEELSHFIPRNMLKKQIQGYIKAYTSNEKTQTTLMDFWDNPMATVDSILKSNKTIPREEYESLKRFFEWCAFDIAKEVSLFCDKLFSDQRVQNIIDLRASGKTLEDVGICFELSRERIRQIEKAAKREFRNFDARHKLTLKIKATENAQELDESNLSKYAGIYTKALFYLMKR